MSERFRLFLSLSLNIYIYAWACHPLACTLECAILGTTGWKKWSDALASYHHGMCTWRILPVGFSIPNSFVVDIFGCFFCTTNPVTL